jgi:hypothetical protein
MGDLLQGILAQYIADFDRLFTITKNGALSASWAVLQEITAFILANQHLILLTANFSFNHFEFEKAHRGDIGTSNRNKVKLLQIYSVLP